MKKVLIVENKENVLRFHAEIVASMGYEFDCANDGLECLEMLKVSKFDLVIMGIKMPRMDGVEALRRIGKAHEGLPVIIVSTLVFENTEADLKGLGAFAVFKKPVEYKALVGAIRGALTKKIAIHEAGHLLINILLTKLPPFKVRGVSISPTKATKIWASPQEGRVENCGFPYCDLIWTVEIVKEMTKGRFNDFQTREEINKETNNLFVDKNLYLESSELTIAAIFSLMAGYIAEKVLVNVSEPYGGDGYKSDKNEGEHFIDVLEHGNDRDDDSVSFFWENYFITQLEVFMKNAAVEKALNNICEAVLSKEVNSEGKYVIEGEELESLVKVVANILKSCKKDFKKLLQVDIAKVRESYKRYM